jgi:hypothetical protein
LKIDSIDYSFPEEGGNSELEGFSCVAAEGSCFDLGLGEMILPRSSSSLVTFFVACTTFFLKNPKMLDEMSSPFLAT